MRLEYLITLAFLTGYSLFGISHGQYYQGYNYRPKSNVGFARAASRPNPNRYFYTRRPNYGLSTGWYPSRQEYWKAKKKMYGYPDGMDSTTMMATTESPSMTMAPYPTQDGMEVVSSDPSFSSTMQSAVTQEVQQPYTPEYPDANVVQPQPMTQDLSLSSSSSSSSSVTSFPLTPATQDTTTTVATSAPIPANPLESVSVQSVQQTSVSPPLTQHLGAQLQQPQSHLLPSSSTGSKLVINAEFKEQNSSRICNPGPPLRPNPRFKNCLIIGDSIALGYLKPVKFLLSNKCQVQHAPFARGSGAMDSRHGLKCLPLLLKTTAMEPTSYDAILFNFGMHDIDYSKRFPEEHVPFDEYKNNLLKLKESFLKTGAKVAFALTTPFPSDKTRNDLIEKFNAEAVRIMEGGQRIPVVNLYDIVVKKCGKPTYDSCSIMKGPRDVHYNEEGNQLLGVRVAATFATLLDQEPRKKRPPIHKAVVRKYFEGGYNDYYIPNDAITCPDAVTRCPIGSTCCESLISLTGYGCCMLTNAVNCPDNWHCCPSGSTCSPTCTVRECKCITYTTSGNRTTINHESKAKAKYLAENKLLNSGTGEHLGKNFKPITDPLLKVLKKLAHAHKSSKHLLKKNAKMLTRKLLDSKGKLQFKNVKYSKFKTRKTKHKTGHRLKTRLHSVNVELGHLIEHHHKYYYKGLKTLLKKGMNQTIHGHFQDKSTIRIFAKPVNNLEGRLHPTKHKKMFNKKQHYHKSSHHSFEPRHNHSNHLQESKASDKDTKREHSKTHVDREHQLNDGIANESLRNTANYSAAKQSLNILANHSKSSKNEIAADRSNVKSRITILKSNKEIHGINHTRGNSRQRSFNQQHSVKDEHVYSGDNSGSGESIGLRDMGSASLDEEYVSGSGMRDNDSNLINPSFDNDMKSTELVQKHSTIQSSKSIQNARSEDKYSNSASGTETPLLNVLLPGSHGEGNARSDFIDDLNPSGDGHATRDWSQDNDITSTSGESFDQTLGESVDDNDDHGFDLMSSALMDNNGANNDVIKEEESGAKRQDIASSTNNKNSRVTDTRIRVMEDRSRSSFITGEDSNENVDDDYMMGNYDKTTEHEVDHDIVKPPMEDKDSVTVDLDDSNNLISLESLLKDNSGYNNDRKSEAPETRTWNTSSEYQDDVQEETPIPSESETSSMNELPLDSLASEDPDDARALGPITINVPKSNMVENPIGGSSFGNSSVDMIMTRQKPALEEKTVEGSDSENSSLETTVTKHKHSNVKNPIDGSASRNSSTIMEMQKPVLVEKPDGHSSPLLKKSTTKTTKNLVESSKKKNKSVTDALPSPKSKETLKTLQRKGNAMMHVNPTRTNHNHMVQRHKAQKELDTMKPRNGNISLNFKKKEESKHVSSKTFASKEDNVENRQQTIFKNQEHQIDRVSSSLKSKTSSSSAEENKSLKYKAISSSNIYKKKGLRKSRIRKKLLQEKSKTSEDPVIGERDDISNETVDDEQTSGRKMLEAYLAAP